MELQSDQNGIEDWVFGFGQGEERTVGSVRGSSEGFGGEKAEKVERVSGKETHVLDFCAVVCNKESQEIKIILSLNKKQKAAVKY